MEVTVKTLDSQTKTFQVSPEATVKDFKAKIADEMKIPVEKQRLIFQGKVLQDDKPLNEYKVDGCVIHLVERQPPRTTRSNGLSTETTTSSTATTSSPANVFMGAFAMPVDVMGVTQQIVQGIIQQIGAESAQANISTSSSDDGSSVNVHINLSTVMARNDARSRIAPARVHLNNVSRIIQRLQNDGLPSSRDLNEENSSSERQSGNGGTENNNNETSLGDLADILQQVVRINDEFRPHLERYQELLRSGRERELRPADDLLPDLAAEALHSLSHAYHALSDVTTNFRLPEPQLNVLPSMSPIPHMRNVPSTSQSQASTSSTGATTRPSTVIPSGIPIGIGLRQGNGLGSGIGLRTGRGMGPTFLRPGFSLRPGNGAGVTFGIRDGPPPLVPADAIRRPPPLIRAPVTRPDRGLSASLTSNSGSSPLIPVAATTSSGSVPVPQNQPQNPFANLPINLRNLPNFAVQFNPASGNITIAHIVTTVVEEPSLRSTTTTTNSTPSPRTSSWDSNSVPDNEANPTPQSGAPMVQSETPTPQGGNPAPQSDLPTPQSGNLTSGGDTSTPLVGSSTSGGDSSSDPNHPDTDMDSSQPPPTSTAASTSPSRAHGNSQSGNSPQPTNAVVNFMPQNAAYRDPLLPCQSFHFTSLVPRSVGSQSSAGGQSARQAPEGQPGDRPSENTITAHILNVSQQRAAAAASSGNTNGIERNPFLDLFTSHSTETIGSRDPADELMLHMATTLEESRRSMTAEELAEDRASVEGQGTLSRYLHRLLETIPLTQLLMTVVAGTGDPYVLTRSFTQEFLRNDILRGEQSTPQNLQRATERILEELKESLESSFAMCNVKENIDAPATLLTYLRPKIRRLLEVVNSSEPDAVYQTEISGLLSRTAAELLALTEYCLKDGRTGMETAVRSSLGSSEAIASLEPALRNMAVDTTWAGIADLRNRVNVRESSLMPFVVRKEKPKTSAKKTDSTSPKVERKEEKKEKSSNARFSASPRGMSTPSSSSRRTRSSSQHEDVPMETDENWKKVIPAEWVPVISQDIIRQQRMPRQAPFSDAYLNGMPPKRRKIQSEPAPYNQCVSATLKRSITKAGVTPKTDLDKLSEEANSSQSLERVFEDEVKSEVRKRLASDTDYNSEKFPSIHKYFENDEKR